MITAQSRQKRSQVLQALSDREALALFYDWRQWARPNQVAPEGEWQNWLVLAGRGFGKTRTGAEWVREQVERRGRKRIALVAPTAGDARDVMVEGESGILAISPPWNYPVYEPSKRRITWPKFKARATLYSADEPDRLRGPQHECAWCDELASWRYVEAWDNLQFGLRLGDHPQNCITTTPRPKDLIRELIKDPETRISRGSTYENAANVARAFLAKIVRKYQGTRLGRQELYAEILDDTPGALWQRRVIDQYRVRAMPEFVRIVIGVDPAVTSGEESDDTGIVMVALGVDGHIYVLRDLTCKMSPGAWGRRIVTMYHHYRADRIVAEVNNGGDLVEHTVRTVDHTVAFKAVHASRGKRVRAEPVAALYEQGLVHHVTGYDDPDGSRAHELNDLEDEMCNFVPDNMDGSPDRVDALVWAITELMLEEQPQEGTIVYYEPVRISPF